MTIFGVTLLAICTLIGVFIGDLLGVALHVKANVGGVGIAILPSSIRALKTDLTVRPVAIDGHAIEFEISAIWSRSTPLPAYGRRFVAALAEHIAREQDGSAVSP